jgi:tetratricopeptide (TPR) repeat protein
MCNFCRKKPRNRLFFVSIFLCFGVTVYAGELSELIIPLREAVYEQILDTNEPCSFYEDAKEKLKDFLSGPALYSAFSRCEYLIGLTYQNNERKNEAARHYQKGIEWAQKSFYSAMGYAYMQQKNYLTARFWLEKSLTLYPTNKFAGNMRRAAASAAGRTAAAG